MAMSSRRRSSLRATAAYKNDKENRPTTTSKRIHSRFGFKAPVSATKKRQRRGRRGLQTGSANTPPSSDGIYPVKPAVMLAITDGSVVGTAHAPSDWKNLGDLAAELFKDLDERTNEGLQHRLVGYRKFDHKKKLMEGALPLIKTLKRCLKDLLDAKDRFVAKSVDHTNDLERGKISAVALLAKHKEDVKTCNATINKLTAECNLQLAKCKELGQELKGITQKKELEMETMRVRLRQELESSRRIAAEKEHILTADLMGKTARVAELTEANRQFEQKYLKVESSLTVVSAEHQALQMKASDLEKTAIRTGAELTAALQRHTDKAEELRQARMQFESSLTVAQGHIAQLGKDKKKAEDQVLDLSAEKARLEGQSQGLENSLADTKAILIAVQVELAGCQKELTTMTERFGQMDVQFQACTKEKDTLTETLEKTADQLTLVRSDFAACQSELGSVTDRLGVAEKQLGERMQQNSTLTTDRDRLQEELAAVQKKAEEAKAVADADLADKVSECTVLQARLVVLEAEKQALLDEKAVQRDQLASVTAELTTLKHHYGMSNDTQLTRLCEATKQKEEYRVMLQSLQSQMTGLQGEAHRAVDLVKRLKDSEGARRALHNKVQELRGNIRVFVRARPFLGDEAKELETSQVRMRPLALHPDGEGVRVSDPFEPTSNGADLPEKPAVHRFKFDKVFGEKASQKDVFEQVSELVQSALDGYNVCIFSYGQTGSGKTWTMQGQVNDEHLRGLIPRSVEQVVAAAKGLRTGGWDYTLEGTFLEIYNETIRDLLRLPNSKKVVHAIKTAGNGQKSVTGLRRVPLTSADQVAQLMKQASEARSVACTDMNEESSRSHCVFTLHLKGVHETSNVALSGALHLCDLAGSERLSRSGATGAALRETRAINKSLSCVADVFHALREKQPHVPYRNSKLTYLLQECFSRDGKTMMLVSVSPTPKSYSETLCSLRFAQQVNQCELGKAKRRMGKAEGSGGAKPKPTPKRLSRSNSSKLSTARKSSKNGSSRGISSVRHRKKRPSPTKSSRGGKCAKISRQ